MIESGTSVLVTTSHRGVFWGRLEQAYSDSRTLTLLGCRNAIRWHTTGGFLELAQVGPNSKTIVGHEAPSLVLHDVTSVAVCTEAATKAWGSK